MSDYRLTISARSPFARRVRLAMRRFELPFAIDVVNVFEPPTSLFERNPLGLVPILQTPAGLELADSAAILEHLHEVTGGRLWPADAAYRLRVRQASAWAYGAMQAVVSHYLESLRPAPDAEWLNEYRRAFERVCERFDASLLGPETQAGWDLAVALDYARLRMPGHDWARRRPELEDARARFAGMPVFAETAPPPA
jgi:glutathione S-transferase